MTADSDPTQLEPQEAHELLQQNPQALMIDVRTTMEHLMIGHPAGAVHVPWLDEPDWSAHPEQFVAKVRETLLGGQFCEEGDCVPVILICRSGRRSLEAGRVLLDAGLPQVYYVRGGFEGPLDESHHRSTRAGWRFHGLPWEQC
ncbi:MAG: rhodanese-like domain-containing protein [Gammaproteobacteria bacterium]|nr:rhodanese-like domain-containing protein [Gammaproteobacteria bacterium]